jgi:hypothetical protein
MGGFKGKKSYGSYKTDICPFCGKASYAINRAKIPVCNDHKDTDYPAIRCICGKWLDVLTGKFGTYCNCVNCGNINLSEALANQVLAKEGAVVKQNKLTQKENLAEKDITRFAKAPETTTKIPLTRKITSSDPLQAEIDRLQREAMMKEIRERELVAKKEVPKEILEDPLEKKCKELGIRSWKDL